MKANLRYTTDPITGNKIITPTYMTWKAMRQRCRDPKAQNYKYYGGRGITYDPRWNDYMVFLQDMGERPPGMTLDREDANKNYCKDNCRWATVDVQHDHMRPRKDSIPINGQIRSASEWSKISGVPQTTIAKRWASYGWTGENLLLPKGTKRKETTIEKE